MNITFNHLDQDPKFALRTLNAAPTLSKEIKCAQLQLKQTTARLIHYFSIVESLATDEKTAMHMRQTVQILKDHYQVIAHNYTSTESIVEALGSMRKSVVYRLAVLAEETFEKIMQTSGLNRPTFQGDDLLPAILGMRKLFTSAPLKEPSPLQKWSPPTKPQKVSKAEQLPVKSYGPLSL